MRTPTDYAVTRAQKRYIARLVANKKQAEETKSVLESRAKLDEFDKHTVPKGEKFCKHSYQTTRINNFVAYERIGSKFATNWRMYRQEVAN